MLKRQPIEKKISQDITLKNLEKIFWPEEGYTKGDLLRYYHNVADYMLPFLKDRPITLHRQPDGIMDKGFYQKNMEKPPKSVPTVAIQHSDKVVHYVVINDLETLLYVVNLGCIEIHIFTSSIHHIEYPDFLLMDLDPEDIPFEKVIETALCVHDILKSIKLKSYCKTSGATGIHIMIPLGGKYNFDHVRTFAQLIATLTNERLPDITSIVRSPSKRQKRVYVDFLQNNRGQTMAAPYCVRPRPHAPVSMPLKWPEVKPGLDPADFTIENALQRIKKNGEILLPMLQEHCDLENALKHLEKMLGG